MTIPEALLTKTKKGKFQNRIPGILEKGWDYLKNHFNNEDNYFKFLESLSRDRFEEFLHTIFFYWAHDLHRLIRQELRDPNIDGFMYQITLSIIEYLNKNISGKSKERIRDFFVKHFSPEAKVDLNKSIIAKALDGASIKLEFWEVLYDMRNRFVHEAQWFNLLLSGSFASISFMKHKQIEYAADIRINFQEYLRFFWEAYLRYFGKRGIPLK